MAVLLFHLRHEFGPAIDPDRLTHFLERSYLFVDFFFVLSGFVIALSYGHIFSRAIAKRDYGNFLVKRLARIYPLHIVMLFGFVLSEVAKYAIATNANPPFSLNTIPALIANIFLVQSWGFYDHATWNQPAWSISTEWFAYLLFPFLFYSLSRLRGLLSSGLLVLACIATLQFYFSVPDDLKPGYYLIRCVPSFALGILVYQFPAIFSRRVAAFFARDIVFALTLIASFTLIALPYSRTITVASFFFVVLAGSLNRGTVARALSVKPLYFLGVISYSVYLTQALILRVWQMAFQVVFHNALSLGAALLALLGMIAVVLILSTISYYLIELPGRDYFRRFAQGRAGKNTNLAASQLQA